MNNNAIEQFINAVREPEYETNTTYSAVVSRVDSEGVAWVNLAGSEKETPTASRAADVKTGDVVTAQWRNNKLYIAGNYSNPSAGVVEVRHVVQVVGDVQQTADDAKETVLQTKKIVDRVKKIAEDTNQYFWHTETGTDTGAHITEIPKEDFIADPTNGGGNLLARSNGIAVRDGLTELATFGADEAQIGQTGESHLGMDYHSMQLIDKEGAAYFYVSDLRSDHTDADEYGEGFYTVITERFIATGIRKLFVISNTPFTENYKVYVNGIEESDVIIDGIAFEFTTAPTEGSIVTATYPTAVQYAKAYTAGLRKNGEIIGIMSFAEGHNTIASGMKSHAEGWNTTASGYYSHAEGVNCTASGDGSHAEGSGNTASGPDSHAEGALTTASGNSSHAQNYDTIAGYWSQTAIGKYNDNQSDTAFEIGNGTSDSARSNALTVDWDGNVEAAGEIHGTLAEQTISITASTGTLQSATVYRQGNVVQLLVSFRKTSATASGGDVFEGTINDTALRPKMITTGGTYYGSHALNATISTAGVITIKNADSRQLDAMTANGNISFTYLVD